MNTPETNAFIKSTAMSVLSISDKGHQIDDYTFAIPIEVEGVQRYAKVTITACNDKATKTTEAFDLDLAMNEFAEKVKTRAEVVKTKKTSKGKTKKSEVED